MATCSCGEVIIRLARDILIDGCSPMTAPCIAIVVYGSFPINGVVSMLDIGVGYLNGL